MSGRRARQVYRSTPSPGARDTGPTPPRTRGPSTVVGEGRPIEITDTPSEGDLRELQAALAASRPAALEEHRRPLASFVRDGDGTLIGGIAGRTHFGWLFVAELWVAESARGQGLGGRLLAGAEHEARRRGCHAAWLDTYSFQARPFYEARGYRLFGELDGYPGEHRKFFLAKVL